MRTELRSFRVFMRQIARDSMLLAVCLVPILCALLFRYGIPALDQILMQRLKISSVFSPYYLLIDLFLSVLTPYMFCFASCMVMLDEQDDNIAAYFAVTPVGKRGYLLSRLVIPTFFSYVVCVLLLIWFPLSKLTAAGILMLPVLSCAMSIVASMLIVSFAGNKVEGMALSKLSGLMMLGIPVPFFMNGGVQYLFAFLPSFWIAKFAITWDPLFFALGSFCSAVWTLLLFKTFNKRFSR